MTPNVLIGVDARSLLQEEVRGEGKTLLRLYQSLALVRPEWRARLYGERHGPPYVHTHFDIRVQAIPGFRWNSWERLLLPLLAARDSVDLLHCSSSSAPPIVGRPFVITVHDIIPLVFDDGQSPEQSRRFEISLRSALRRADAVIAVSESTKRDLVAFFGIQPSRICVIHWGADLPTNIIATGRSDRDPNLVLAFGGDAPRKNTRGLLVAFAAASRSVPSSRLVLVGLSGAKKRFEYQLLAQRLAIQDRVSFEGFVSDDDLTRLYRRATVLLYPSLYEGFGMPIVEAMAEGLPVVASNRASIPEVLAGAGLLADPADEEAMGAALAQVLLDPLLGHHHSTLGIARARQLTWERCATLTADVFERVLQRQA